MGSKVIKVEGDDIVSVVFGSCDANVEIVEKKFSVAVHNRVAEDGSDVIVVSGEDESLVSDAYAALKYLVKMAKDARKEIARKLYGDIRVVNSCPDFDVRVVSSAPDLDVRVVSSRPSKPGEWRFVNSCADFDVRFVDSGADIDIRFVNSNPGPR